MRRSIGRCSLDIKGESGTGVSSLLTFGQTEAGEANDGCLDGLVEGAGSGCWPHRSYSRYGDGSYVVAAQALVCLS